jgi:TetR/AcrR family transcriptional regulator, transcriptional repressor for nem operon
MEPGDKRARLVEAAARVIYERGYQRTTLADIAEASGVPLGNVYYYFKTKEALGHALIEHRLASHRALREGFDAHSDPRARLEAFVASMASASPMLAASGCPIGSLCSELHKYGGALARSSSRPLTEYLDWLEAQFRALGCDHDAARNHAVHLMSTLQGSSLLAQSFGDPAYVARETQRAIEWIRTIRPAGVDGAAPEK